MDQGQQLPLLFPGRTEESDPSGRRPEASAAKVRQEGTAPGSGGGAEAADPGLRQPHLQQEG